jgi:amino acid adenylation domain-containing protein
VAVLLGDQQLTYLELDQNANQLAHYLHKLGVQRETVVGICLERSTEMVVALLAVLKAGGAYLPLDPTYPRDRLAFLLEDSRAPFVITSQLCSDSLPQEGARVVRLDRDSKLIAAQSREKPSEPLPPESLAYVIYTSGSSGKPKGVQIPHRAVVNFLSSMRREPGLSAQDALLAVTSLSSDIAVLELLLPLVVGARVVLATGEESADGALLAAKIARSNITVLQAMPATWRLLLDSGWRGNPSLRLFSGGETLSREMANQMLERCAELWNLYGPTETTVWSAAARIEPGNGPIVIGRPIANTEFYVLDPHLEPVPVGVPGELFIGGDGLARGYLDRPELTAEKFVRHPFQDDPRARLYRTGDRARWHTDGNIELLGRVDNQVKIRGFRIEPGEIEAVLLKFPAVREAVVVAREERPGDKRLVAYLTSYRQSTVSLNELRRFLHQKLPDHMVPATFVMLDKLPLTPNGKVDRLALPAPDPHRSAHPTAFVAPRTGLEQTIAAIWEGVLALRNPGANDNFFDLGGRSLEVVQVQNRIRETLGIEPPLIQLFQYPTIHALAGCLDQEKNREPFTQKIHEWTWRHKSAADNQKQKPFGARVKL